MIYVIYEELKIPRINVLLLDKKCFIINSKIFGLFFYFKYFAINILTFLPFLLLTILFSFMDRLIPNEKLSDGFFKEF